MLADTIMNRITELREQKGVSEREMSIALGKSPNYLYFMKKNNIFSLLSRFYNRLAHDFIVEFNLHFYG